MDKKFLDSVLAKIKSTQGLIVLPPKDFTANHINQTNSDAEVERANITVKGAVRPDKRAFSKIKNCLLVVSFNDASLVSDLDKPYLQFDLNGTDAAFSQQIHSAGTPPFPVVRPDGTGVYHSLINLSADWLVMQLHKVLYPQKEPDSALWTSAFQNEHTTILNRLWQSVLAQGDALFTEQPALIDSVLSIPLAQALPVLTEMLHIKDTGKHEACTIFAIILKLDKCHPDSVKKFLKGAAQREATPVYYADQLIENDQPKSAHQESKRRAGTDSWKPVNKICNA